MGVRVNFKNVPESGQGGTIPLGRHPVRLHIDAYQVDQDKNPMLDGDGNKVYYRSTNDDIQWKIRCEILDGPFQGREIFDQLTFSSGGLKRIRVLASRIGMPMDQDLEMEPEDLDGSYWYIDVDRHEVAQGKGGVVKESKYTFRRGSCVCDSCKQWDGKNVNMNARIAFAGFELMDSETAARLSKVHKSTNNQLPTGDQTESENAPVDKLPF